MACCAVNCKSHSSVRSEGDIGVAFHRFPQNPILREQWISATGRRQWQPKKHSRLCSKHFLPDCYTSGSKRRELHTNALPTIFCSESAEHKFNASWVTRPPNSPKDEKVKKRYITRLPLKRTTDSEESLRVDFSSDDLICKRRNITALKTKTSSSPDKIFAMCRACLAAGVRMFRLNADQLGDYRDLLGVQSESDSEATMKMSAEVCYECSALLGRFRDFRARAHRAHAALARILLRADAGLEQSIKEVDRASLGLESRLSRRTLDALSIAPDAGHLGNTGDSAFKKSLNRRKQFNELTRLTSRSSNTLKKSRSFDMKITKKEHRCNHCKKKFMRDLNIEDELETKPLTCDSCKEQCQSSVTLFKPRLGQRSTHAYIEMKENSILKEVLQEREDKMEKIVKNLKSKKIFVKDKMNEERKVQNKIKNTINTFGKQKKELKSVIYDEIVREIKIIDMTICERKSEGDIEAEGNLSSEDTEKVLSDDPLYMTKVDNEIRDARMYDWEVETL